MSEITEVTHVFDFKGHKVRTAGTFEAPLFCAADICAALGISSAGHAVERLDQEDVCEVVLELQSSKNRAVFVTEPGMYELTMTSRKPDAKAFKRWITHDVIPEIRKRGYYSLYEQKLQKEKSRLLQEYFPNLPGPSKNVMSGVLDKMLRKFGWAPVSRKPGPENPKNPPWGVLVANRVWDWACRIPDQQKHRREMNPAYRCSDGKLRTARNASDIAMLDEGGEQEFKRVCEFGELLVETAASWQDWMNKMELTFGKSAVQLPIMVPMVLATANDE